MKGALKKHLVLISLLFIGCALSCRAHGSGNQIPFNVVEHDYKDILKEVFLLEDVAARVISEAGDGGRGARVILDGQEKVGMDVVVGDRSIRVVSRDQLGSDSAEDRRMRVRVDLEGSWADVRFSYEKAGFGGRAAVLRSENGWKLEVYQTWYEKH